MLLTYYVEISFLLPIEYIKVPAMSIGSITEIRPQSNVLLTKVCSSF